MTDTAQGAQFDFNVLFVIALPVLLAVWIYLVYAIVMWRASRGGPEPVGGPAARGHLGIQVGWILTTTVIVLFLAGFGTYELVQPGGAGGGAGLEPDLDPDVEDDPAHPGHRPAVEVHLPLPDLRRVRDRPARHPRTTRRSQFNVTSLDVIHSFWAYQLGVKADANPDYNNVAYTTTQQLGSFIVRCAELCGIWHGAMYNSGVVVTPAAVRGAGRGSPRSGCAGNTKLLPPYALTYTPDANGADGGYYPDNVDPYSNVETYGAPQPKGG